MPQPRDPDAEIPVHTDFWHQEHCPICKKKLARARTGRPARFCSNACRLIWHRRIHRSAALYTPRNETPARPAPEPTRSAEPEIPVAGNPPKIAVQGETKPAARSWTDRAAALIGCQPRDLRSALAFDPEGTRALLRQAGIVAPDEP